MRPTRFLAVLLSIPALIPAAGAAENDLAAVPLEQLMGIPVIKAASRFEQLITEAPGSAVVLDSDDIRTYGWRTLAEALATLPGMIVSSDRNYGYLGTRGILRPGDYNGRFVLTIDGVRTNDAVYDQVLIGHEGLIDMDMVQRIEYVPGAGSAVYGSNALLGVINVVTRDGNALQGPRIGAAAGSQGERKLRASWGWHGKNGADILLAASAYERDGGDLYYPEFDTGAPHGGVAHGLDGERARNFLAKLGYGDLTLTASHVHRSKEVPTASFGAVFDAPNRTVDTQTMVQLAHVHAFSSGATLSAQLVWGRADYLGSGPYPDADGRPVPNVDGDHARWYSFDTHLTIERFDGHRIVIGADLERDARQDQFNFDRDPYAPLLDDRRQANRRGVFVEDEMRLGERVLLNASVRHDRYGNDERSSSPRLALLYRISRDFTGKLVYGRAFRVPNAYEKYYVIEGTGGQQLNPELGPERIRTYEAVLEHALGTTGHARLSLYRYDASSLITQQVDGDTGMLVFRNAERARTDGAEASLERVFANAARLRASLTWQHGRDGKGEALRAVPGRLAKINASAPLAGGLLHAGAELQCMSRRLTQSASTGAYCVANLNLSSARLVRDADLSFGVYNLGGRHYADPAGPAFVQQALARPGRNVYTKLDYRF